MTVVATHGESPHGPDQRPKYVVVAVGAAIVAVVPEAMAGPAPHPPANQVNVVPDPPTAVSTTDAGPAPEQIVATSALALAAPDAEESTLSVAADDVTGPH